MKDPWDSDDEEAGIYSLISTYGRTITCVWVRHL